MITVSEEGRDSASSAVSHGQIDDQIELLGGQEVGHVVQLTVARDFADVFVGPFDRFHLSRNAQKSSSVQLDLNYRFHSSFSR